MVGATGGVLYTILSYNYLYLLPLTTLQCLPSVEPSQPSWWQSLSCQSFFANIFIKTLRFDELQQCLNCLGSAASLFVLTILQRGSRANWMKTNLNLCGIFPVIRPGLLNVCSVFSICTWHRMLEQCSEETSSSRHGARRAASEKQWQEITAANTEKWSF